MLHLFSCLINSDVIYFKKKQLYEGGLTMKKWIYGTILLCISAILFGCVMILPNKDSIGEPRKYQKDGLTITLTDRFKEQESELGFDAYYTSDFGAVMVLKEEFTLEEGLAEKELSEYIKSVIANNGHTDIQPKNRDGLWYYYKDNGNLRYYSYCFKGTDAFWIVQFGCFKSQVVMMEDQIFFWAKSVEVE